VYEKVTANICDNILQWRPNKDTSFYDVKNLNINTGILNIDTFDTRNV
jgi:hypothetical protein